MSNPARARSHGGHRHALIAQDLADGTSAVAGWVKKLRSRWENLDGIKAQLLCQSDVWGEISPEHKWASLGFGNKRKGDRRTHFHWIIYILRGVFIISSFTMPSYPQHFSREFRAVLGRLWVFQPELFWSGWHDPSATEAVLHHRPLIRCLCNTPQDVSDRKLTSALSP